MGHDHDHHHDHGIAVTKDNKSRVFTAMILTFGFMMVELVGGLVSGSLALLADAGHMLSDGAALLLSWYAFKVSDKQADSTHSFGWHRFQILAAFVNGVTLVVIAIWIIIEAIQRFMEPAEILSTPMLVIASLGLLVNVVVFNILSGGNQKNLNLKSAMAHVLGDILGSVAAILAAILIILFEWYIADPILSLLVAFMIIRSGIVVVKKSSHILIEGSPHHFDPELIKTKLINEVESVNDVHHIHAWSLTNDYCLITLHVSVEEVLFSEDVLKLIKDILERDFQIQHSTMQIEHFNCPDFQCTEHIQ